MSESIWSREIEEGLKNFLNTFMLYIRGENKGNPIKVKVRNPDEDFKQESYPIIYLQGLQQKLSTVRYNPYSEKVISQDEENNTMVVEEAPIPFDCAYQIDFYSLYASELNTMVQKFLANTHGGRYFNLPVKDQSGNDWDLFVIRRGGTMTKRDYFDEDTRLFHSTYNFTVQTQLNENIRHTKYLVLDREIVNTGELS